MTDGIELDGEQVTSLAHRVRVRASGRGDLGPTTVISGAAVTDVVETAADTWRRELVTSADVLRELVDALKEPSVP